MEYRATIKVGKEKAKELQAFLDSEGTDSDEVIEVFSHHFVEIGRGVDIKVCDVQEGMGGPYVDAVLFETVMRDPDGRAMADCDWHEIGPLDISDTLLGEYIFEDEGVTLIVEVVA